MIAVIDASVVIKWLLQDPERETGTEKATQLMELVTNGEQPVLQPTHWLVESRRSTCSRESWHTEPIYCNATWN